MTQYNPIEDLQTRTRNLASLLYILGYADDELDSVSIDDAINKIRDVYVYKHDISMNVACQEYVKKQSIVLSRNIRRAWFDVQFASFEVHNVG